MSSSELEILILFCLISGWGLVSVVMPPSRSAILVIFSLMLTIEECWVEDENRGQRGIGLVNYRVRHPFTGVELL